MDYNGWTNKETWLVNIWLDDMLQSYFDEGQEISVGFIEMLVDEMASELAETSGFITDLLNCSLGEINYHEIASHYETEESE